jgi:hypothetical protein
VIARIEQLFRGELPATPQANNPVARATQLTGLFTGHYVHTIPFDRRVLSKAWSACRGNPSVNASCQQTRQQVDERFERFDLENRSFSGGREAN